MGVNEAPIVRSLLETDLYKFTMWQALLHSHPGAQVEYSFLCRNATVFPLAELKDEVERELDHLCTLSFTQDELDYLSSLRFIKSDFVDFLTVFRFQRRFVEVSTDGERLQIHARGPLVHVMGFEIYMLYIVNELYFRRLPAGPEILAEARRRLAAKVALLKDVMPELCADPEWSFTFSDFGLRRRYSGPWHDEVVRTFAREVPEFFRGTSNVHQARLFNLTPIGTMAHEYMQAYQSFRFPAARFPEGRARRLGPGIPRRSGHRADRRRRHGCLSVRFDLYFAKLFDGLRHDSGDPIEWGEKAIAHYRKLRIDPTTKRLVFSDSLSLPRALEIWRHFKGRIATSFGIGTDLTKRHAPRGAEHRDEDRGLQRPGGRQAVRRRGQDPL